jgi:hypothetical protein
VYGTGVGRNTPGLHRYARIHVRCLGYIHRRFSLIAFSNIEAGVCQIAGSFPKTFHIWHIVRASTEAAVVLDAAYLRINYANNDVIVTIF